MGAEGAGPAVGTGDTGSGEASGAGDKGCSCYAACIIKSPSSAHSGVVRGHIEFRVLWT